MLCVPLDHGVTLSDISHLAQFSKMTNAIIDNGASALIVHKGMVKFLPEMNNTGLIVHLSASTEKIVPVKKEIVCDVLEALSLGADAVSVHINLGNDFEKFMLADLARVSRDCRTYGVPLFAMMYVRDNNNKDISDIVAERHSIRIATELGADIVKIGSNYDKTKLDRIIEDALIPVVVAGGDLLDPRYFYKHTEELMESNICGVSFGRNVFMADNPGYVTKKLSQIIFKEI